MKRELLLTHHASLITLTHQLSKGYSLLNRLPSHYRLVKRSSHYDLMPRSRKGNSFWLSMAAVLIGIFCFGPNAIVVTRILQGLYRASPLALEALSSIIHLK
ncbi:MAG: hypothetical protein NT075_02955 [Chloroflexi bacterium]|nr:hypothetical protein [Chloroflexota bacterium]